MAVVSAAVPSPDPSVWDGVVELTKRAQEKGCDPFLWAAQLSSTLSSAGVALPSTELAHVLVSHVCWGNDVPMAWKYLEKVVSMNLVPPMLVLALLSVRVIPMRKSRPVAYRLYLELLKRHSFSFTSQMGGPDYQKIAISIDEVLHLSQTFGIQVSEPGILVVGFVFTIFWQLLDATLDDGGLLNLTSEKVSRWSSGPRDMDIDAAEHFNKKSNESYDKLQKMNTLMAIELLAEFLQHKTTSRLLYLARNNMSLHWAKIFQWIEVLAANSSALESSTLSPDSLIHLSSSYMPLKFSLESKLGQHKRCHTKVASGAFSSLSGHCYQASWSALWIPLDMFLEDCLDGSLVAASCAVEILYGLIKALQAVNGTTWHDTFLGVWLAALRLVQRERDPIEGPVPGLETRLCILLSITTQSIADIIEEEMPELDENKRNSNNQWKDEVLAGQCRKGLVSSLQVLGDYEGLLSPPQSVVSVANQAALKAIMFASGLPVGSGYLECIGINDNSINCTGNLQHLIVEACIARKLIDTSAYFWPGYVSRRINQIPHGVAGQGPSWSVLMKGAPLTPSMINALVTTPVSSLAELEKIFEIALNGSDDERASAATILCGASLIRGWNVQEYTVRFVMKLLSPPRPVDYCGSESHLIGYAPMLYILLTGISPVDCAQIFSLQGLVPELAGELMAICEVFGSCVPNVVWIIPPGEKITAHSVFSIAFILLLRLWKFNYPALEHCVSDSARVGSQLTPEYLLLLRNSKKLSNNGSKRPDNSSRYLSNESSASALPIFVDFFPKLKVWYRQHQACIASTLSGLVHGTPVHQTVDGLLKMMFKKMNKGRSQSVAPGASGNSSLSSSSAPTSEDSSLRPKLPAWEILEAVPFVVDAALSACSHGRLSPRELATGLKDLADFLPASLATIVSYFSAEVTRGVWRPAEMNGTDWPSPAANLAAVEENIKKIVAATGVNVPSLVAGSSLAILPLPLAAFVSLTITYKLDRSSERFLNLAGPALENLAAGCPWPSMPIVSSLWAQKVKRWSDYLIFSASRTVFNQNRDAVVQLLKSCFTAALGLSAAPVSSNSGVEGLLGHGFGSHRSGGFLPVAPGFLYLRVYRSIRDIMFVREEILSLLVLTVGEVADNEQTRSSMEKLKKTKYSTKYGQTSLAAAMTKVKAAAGVGASLLWLSGGFTLVQMLYHETLPSWFLSCHGSEYGVGGGMAAVLRGYALAHFAVLCGTFSCGLDITNVPRHRSWIIGTHMGFLADAVDGKITLGCNWATWHAYVTGFVRLMLKSTPSWVMAVDVDVLRRLSKGLRQWNEEELAMVLLGAGGSEAMGAAAELIISSRE